MKYTELDTYIEENKLLTHNIQPKAGIYAITIDGGIVYIGQSKNVRQRCGQHIYNTENAMLNQEKKYLLLLSAKLGGHVIDCYGICYGEEDSLLEAEKYYINEYLPILNIIIPGHENNDISNLKIEDVLKGIRYEFETKKLPQSAAD